jgi:hypothetical protein
LLIFTTTLALRRSHRVILEIPSRLFYAGALEERADRRRTEFLAGWDRMPRDARGEAFPVLMIGECSVAL